MTLRATGEEEGTMVRTGERLSIFTFPDARLLIRLSPTQSGAGNFLVRPFRVVCGFQTVSCDLIPDASVRSSQALVTSGLMGRLHMNDMPTPVHASLREGQLKIGPNVGILCNPRWDSKNKTMKSTSQLAALQKLLEAAESMGVRAYLFRVEDVDFDNLSVRAYALTARGWRSVRAPLPDVIYDQLISRRRERSAEHAKLRLKLSKLYGGRIFNDGFFDKWQVHEWLSKEKRMLAHLPKTIRYTGNQAAHEFVKRHATVYMKPVHGSLGLGIVKVANQSDGTLTYEIKRPNQAPVSGRSTTTEDMMKSFRKRLTGRPYVLQQGIPLATYDGRPFDIRILLQRDGSGEWKRTKAFARITKPGDITSNLSSGGEAMPMTAVLERIFPNRDKRRNCKAQVQRVSRWVAEAIEQNSGKTFGELGVDLGVDPTGHVWVIEVNSKPWKSPTTEKGSQHIVDLAFERPIAYAAWLAENQS